MPGPADTVNMSCLCRRIHCSVHNQLSGMDILRRDTRKRHLTRLPFSIHFSMSSGTYRLPVQFVWDFFVSGNLWTADIYGNEDGIRLEGNL